MTVNSSLVASARFVPRGVAAIDPQALGVDYCALAAPIACEEAKPTLAVVNIRGPLSYELTAPQFFDTYDNIRCRFDLAIAAGPKTIALRIASPGGDVSGSFELARYMRAKAKTAGIRLIAHSEAQICSAAYVLACAADEIYCTETASIGSIGVIVQPTDATAADAAQGIKFAIISSGERKADGNPHVALSADARDAIQATVDTLAGLFFAHVGDARGDKLTATKARALQAGIRVGHAALGAGLVDGVCDWAALCDELSLTEGTIAVTSSSAAIAAISAKASMADKDDKSDKDEKPKEDAVRASLVTASTSDDEKKAAKAKAALAAYDVDDDSDDEKKKKDEKAKAASEAAVAQASADAALAASKATLAQVAAQAAAATAEIAAMKAAAEVTERASLVASRKDLSAAVFATVAHLPLADAKAIINLIPNVGNPLAPKAVSGTVGDPSLIGGHSTLSAAEAAELDAKFGIGKAKALGSVVIGGSQFFGVPVDANTPGVVK